MDGHPMIQLHPILTHLATIPAIAIASYKALNVWRAVSALPLNPHSTAISESPSTPSATSQCLEKWRALTTTKKGKNVAIFLIIVSFAFGFNVFFIYVLPRITSQSVLDTIFCIFLVAVFTQSIRYASDVAFPTPKSVRYHQANPESPMTISFAFEGDKKTAWKIEILRQSLSFFTTIGILYFTWAGYIYFYPIIAAAYLILAIGTLRYPRMSIRRIIQGMCACLTIVPVLSIIIGVVQQQFTHNSQDEEGTDKKDNITLASDWVLSLMFIFGHILGPMIPSIITAMTLRFEYTLVNEPLERPSETSSEAPVRIPNEYPSFPKPIFLSSLFSLFTSIVIIETITYTIPDLVWLSITPLSVFVTVPIVIGGTALGAAWCGKFRHWWRYSEVWIPAKKATNTLEENHKDLDEAELALLPSEAKVMA
ncbi:hypothetical protein I308_103004 [Cryptococcus tetragattii IND107]|uniref:Uncharacterized protein n=1 Tax=Cryptococcus tetragattii IND107 TaxID=1296105 RepID=A0ABR3BUD0_9TREE